MVCEDAEDDVDIHIPAVMLPQDAGTSLEDSIKKNSNGKPYSACFSRSKRGSQSIPYIHLYQYLPVLFPQMLRDIDLESLQCLAPFRFLVVDFLTCLLTPSLVPFLTNTPFLQFLCSCTLRSDRWLT